MRLLSRQTRLMPNGWSVLSNWQPKPVEMRLPSTPTCDPSEREEASHSCLLEEKYVLFEYCDFRTPWSTELHELPTGGKLFLRLEEISRVCPE